MMKTVYGVAFLFLLAFSLCSVDIFESPLSAEGEPGVETVFNRIGARPVVKCRFSQAKTIARLDRTIESSGVMLFDSAEGIAWIMESPFPSTTLLTDSAMIQKSRGGQSRIMSAEGNETFYRFSRTIQSVFLGHLETIYEEYDLYYLPDSGEGWKIGLVPKDSVLKQFVASFVLTGSDYIGAFTINEPNGDDIIYRFSDIEFPDALNDEDRHVFQ